MIKDFIGGFRSEYGKETDTEGKVSELIEIEEKSHYLFEGKCPVTADTPT